MKKHVVFDFDGTLLNTDRLIINSWQAVFRNYRGENGDEDLILSTFGETVAHTMRKLFPEINQNEAMELYRTYQREHSRGAYSLYPGVAELIDNLIEKGFKTSIVTSRLKKTTFQYLNEMGIEDKFDLVLTADDVDMHKPDPKPLLKAMEKLGTSKEDTIMLGDTKFDIGCCNNAGVDSVLVEWGHRIIEDVLEGYKPTYRIKKPKDLFYILER